MKLYTRPRPLHPYQLRSGDQVATNQGRELVRVELTLLDLELTDDVIWAVVHEVRDVPMPGTREEWSSIVHTLDEERIETGSTVLVREVVPLDPWSYVKPEREAS